MAFFGKGGRGDTRDAGQEVGHFAMLAEVRAYWEGLRQGTDLPRRDDIDPRGIAGALENTFLLERVAPGIARFRLAGMQLHDLMGMDVRGMPLSSLIEPQGRSRMAEALEAVFAGPGALEMSLEGERGHRSPAACRAHADLAAEERRWSGWVGDRLSGAAGRSWPGTASLCHRRGSGRKDHPAQRGRAPGAGPDPAPAFARIGRGCPAVRGRNPPPAARQAATAAGAFAGLTGKRCAEAHPTGFAGCASARVSVYSAMRRFSARRDVSSSATRKASSSDCDAFRRGSQAVW